MKTGYFNTLRNNIIEGAVSIAIGAPKYVNIPYEYKALAPSWPLLNKFRKDQITEAQYIEEFAEQLMKLDPVCVKDDLEAMCGSRETVLMCHCSPGQFCHRHLVAEWLESTTGAKIHEYTKGDVNRAYGYAK
jgi:uncharacterized protein YeaO (DUF488 family)